MAGHPTASQPARGSGDLLQMPSPRLMSTENAMGRLRGSHYSGVEQMFGQWAEPKVLTGNGFQQTLAIHQRQIHVGGQELEQYRVD